MTTLKLPLLILSFTSIFLIFHVRAYAVVRSSEVKHAASAEIGKPASISSNSILLAFLETPYTDFLALADQASLLQKIELSLTEGDLKELTIFAPENHYISKIMDPEFRLFLAEPGNAEWLLQLLKFHILPAKLTIEETKKILSTKTDKSVHLATLYGNGEKLIVSVDHRMDKVTVQTGMVKSSDVVVREDGVVHGVDTLLVPISVQKAFNSWKEEKRGMSRFLAAVQPESAPTPDRVRNIKHSSSPSSSPSPSAISSLRTSSPSLSPSSLPSPSFKHTGLETVEPSAPASASASSPSFSFNGETAISDFVSTLIAYGGYDEIADLLVNLTSLAPHLALLVKEGHRLTILAPNDEAMNKLTIHDLADPNAPENLLLYHIIPEYQTEESFYSAVKKFGSVSYPTLRGHYKILAHEEDGTVVFNQGKKKAYLIDIDIFTNAHISVQGLDGVLTPVKQPKTRSKNARKLVEDEHEYVESDTSMGTSD